MDQWMADTVPHAPRRSVVCDNSATFYRIQRFPCPAPADPSSRSCSSWQPESKIALFSYETHSFVLLARHAKKPPYPTPPPTKIRHTIFTTQRTYMYVTQSLLHIPWAPEGFFSLARHPGYTPNELRPPPQRINMTHSFLLQLKYVTHSSHSNEHTSRDFFSPTKVHYIKCALPDNRMTVFLP